MPSAAIALQCGCRPRPQRGARGTQIDITFTGFRPGPPPRQRSRAVAGPVPDPAVVGPQWTLLLQAFSRASRSNMGRAETFPYPVKAMSIGASPHPGSPRAAAPCMTPDAIPGPSPGPAVLGPQWTLLLQDLCPALAAQAAWRGKGRHEPGKSNVYWVGWPMVSGMRPRGSQKELERRRRRAVVLAKEGFGPAKIARRLWTTPRTVCRWLKSRREGGTQALAARPVPGRPAKLTPRQRRALASCLLKGATACGFADDRWTCQRIARLIRRRFGSRYHVDSIPRLVAGLSFSPL